MNSIEAVRQRILEQAVNGELVPQNEKDEPASVLLEKIIAEKKRLVDEKIIKKQVALSPIPEDEIPFEAPTGWEWIRLGEVINLVSGQHVESAKYNDKGVGIAYLTGPTDFGEKTTNITKWTEQPKVLVNKGDILMTVKGSGVGKLNILSEDASIGRQLMAIQGILIEKEFLLYLLMICNEKIKSKKVGVAIPGISREDILDLVIALPPLAEQGRIVEKASRLLSMCETLVSESKIQQDYMSVIREKVLDDALHGLLVSQDDNEEPATTALSKIQEEKKQLIKEKKIKKQPKLPAITEEEIPFEIPENWTWVRLGEMTTKLGAGKTPLGGEKHYTETGIPFIRSQNVRNEGLDLTGVAHIPEETHATMQGSVVEKTDILLNITGGSIGRSCIISDDFITANVNQHVAIIRLVNPSIRYFIHSCIISSYFQSEIMRVQVGASREGLSMDKLSKILVPFPPLEEQKRIMDKVDNLFRLLDELERNVVE